MTFNVCVFVYVCVSMCVFMDMKSIQTEFVCQADFMDICVKWVSAGYRCVCGVIVTKQMQQKQKDYAVFICVEDNVLPSTFFNIWGLTLIYKCQRGHNRYNFFSCTGCSNLQISWFFFCLEMINKY